MTALIVANGQAPLPEAAQSASDRADLVIAANGGLLHCRALGIEPDMVVGDMDSLSPAIEAELADAGVQVHRFPADKDETDLELALALAAERGHTEILVLAAFGGRWDQTLANMLLPASARFRQLDIRLMDGRNRARIVTPTRPASWRGRAGDLVSLIPLSAHASGVTSVGLAFALQAETLQFGETRGISNRMLAEQAQVQLTEGLLLCIHSHSSESG